MKNILFIGGDKRMIYAYEEFKKQGYTVSSFGLFQADEGKIEDNEIIIFPVPITRDKITVNCPITNAVIPLKETIEKCGDRQIFGGCYKGKNNFTDYCELDDYCLLNAVPTAEGAISFAIENTPFTLWESKVLVIGAGRVGKILADRLKGLKCDITVTARKARDFALLEALGIEYTHTDLLHKIKNNFDIIFNTVDVNFFSDIDSLPKNALLIDLSSLGCTNFSAAREMGYKAYKLPGIPGKNAPKTAGVILANTLIKLIN
ncbi:MAG: hypothetical protein J6J13_03585 [Clostridia bacterium]|nr:hypothetical protein [Clostridia bacterium]